MRAVLVKPWLAALSILGLLTAVAVRTMRYWRVPLGAIRLENRLPSAEEHGRLVQ